MKILNTHQVNQKTKRLAIEILENNCDETQIILAGINNNGMTFAKMIHEAMKSITIIQPEIILTGIILKPANPLQEEVLVQLPLQDLENKVIVIIDDVANTGRTLQFAMKPLLNIIVKKIEVAVLIDRKHKSFPVRPNYVGLELATTLLNNIEVQIQAGENEEKAVYLK